MSDELFAALRQAVIDGDAGSAGTLAQQALDTVVPPLAAIDNGLVPGLSYLGEEFGKAELFLPDMMLAHRPTQKATPHHSTQRHPHHTRHHHPRHGTHPPNTRHHSAFPLPATGPAHGTVARTQRSAPPRWSDRNTRHDTSRRP